MSGHADVEPLVLKLSRYLDGVATIDDVHAATVEVCRGMHSGHIPPQTMLVALKGALREAALRADNPVTTEMFRAMNNHLTPWLIEVCFESH